MNAILANTRFRVVVGGIDKAFTLISNPNWIPLETRFAQQLRRLQNDTYGRDVIATEAVNITTSQTAAELLTGKYSYIATVSAKTLTGFSNIEDAASWIRSAFIAATGFPPSSVTVSNINGSSTGSDVPQTPTTLIGGLDTLLTSITQGSNVLTWALVAGAVAFIFIAVRNPGSAAKTAKIFT